MADPGRKACALARLLVFLNAYFPKTFMLPWSDDHREVIARLEEAITRGGLSAIAMPRGSGKTSMARGACLWAVLGGWRRYVLLLGGDEEKAGKNLRAIKTELETNDLLAADFPEVCHPIRALEGISQRAKGQTCAGKPTHLGWTQREIVLPTIAGSQASGAILQVDGLLGAVRGPNYTTPSGETIRPDLVIGDDLQTDDSARSELQVNTRLGIISGALLGLAGPDVDISGVILGTVIEPGDCMAQLLNRAAHPAWHGIRKQLVYQWPDATALWEEYAQRLRQELENDGDGSRATEFYRRNREAMDAGAQAAWPERHTRNELSAIQHAYNLLITRGIRAYSCEYQNDPEKPEAGERLTAEEIRGKLNGRPRGEVPTGAEYLVAHVDVHDRLLYWTAAAFGPDFTGHILDYGTWPEQRREYFTMRQAARTLRTVAPKGTRTKEGGILEGLLALWSELLAREWSSEEGGPPRRLQLVLVDCGYLPHTIERAIARDGRSQLIRPARGVPIGAANRPISEWTYKPGDRRGFNWGTFRRKGRRYRSIEFDANAWKTFRHARLSAAAGEPGSLTLWGSEPRRHTLYSEHQAAETPHDVESQGRRVQQWLQTTATENHWGDTLVGCLVAASYLGAALPATAAPGPRRRRRRGRFRPKRH